MALVACKECGKEVSSTAKSCPHCGIKKPAPKIRGAFSPLALLLIFLVSGVFLSIQQKEVFKERAAKEAADPNCHIAKIDGTVSGRLCDLRKLCEERKTASNNAERANMEVVDADSSDRDKFYRLRESQKETRQSLAAIDEQLSIYRPEDKKKICGALLAPSVREIMLEKLYEPKVATIYSCELSPLDMFENKTYQRIEIWKILDNNCKGDVSTSLDPELSAQKINVEWLNQAYEVTALLVDSNSSGAPRFRITSINSKK